MNKRTKTYRLISVIFTVIAVIGLAAYFGGMKSVNAGAFTFPAVAAAWTFSAYLRNSKRDKEHEE